MKEYQVTLICKSGKYKPVSTIVKAEGTELRREIQIEGQKKIMLSKGWSMADLKRFDYTGVKIREYDREKIAQEQKERAKAYEKLKEEKYASGEWKRPKGKA